MKVAIAQINTAAGDVQGNLQKMLRYLAEAGAAGADLVVFPELTVSGWAPMDLLREQEFVAENESALAQVAAAAKGVGVLVGHVGRDDAGRFTSAASLFADGECLGTFGQTPLDELDPWSRAAGQGSAERIGRATVKGMPVAAGVGGLCPSRLQQSREELGAGAGGGVAALIHVCAVPFHKGCAAWREEHWSGIARRLGVPVVWVNLVGGNDTAVFDGASFVLDAEGGRIAGAGAFDEDLLVVNLESMERRAGAPALSETAQLYAALKLGVADYVRKCGFQEVVLGLSGGIDSAVVSAIAADALGPEHVTALGMPSAYSSEGTREAARIVAGNLGIKYHVLPIEQVRAAFEGALAPLFAGRPRDTAEENIQARIRGTLLMAYANKFHALALATGNRSELAVGYCTLYGDTAGGLAVIGDVPKTVVYELTAHVNRAGGVIPHSVIQQPPSAELKPDQTDQDVLPPYEVLDGILELYLDRGLGPGQIVQEGFDPATVSDVIARVKRAEFKRRQTPPALQVMGRGGGRPRYPLAGPCAP